MDTDSEDDPDEHVVAPFIPATPTTLTPQQKPVTYDEIVVEQPPPDAIFSIISGPLADSIPKSFKDALLVSRPDRKFWWGALCAEIMATIQNGTWTLEDLPPGIRAIPLRWVFRIKLDAKGKFEKYKGRIVVKGYSQIVGLNFNETFAPVVRIESIRVIFALAANDLYILHIECKNPFLHGESDVEIYVTQPEGFLD